MANKLTNAWLNNQREVDGWIIDSRCDSRDRAESSAKQILPGIASATKIVHEGDYFYILLLPTAAEKKLLAALND